MLLTHAFEILQGLCTHEEVSSMYHDLVKRLDDSNNDVRTKAVCMSVSHPVRCGGLSATHS